MYRREENSKLDHPSGQREGRAPNLGPHSFLTLYARLLLCVLLHPWTNGSRIDNTYVDTRMGRTHRTVLVLSDRTHTEPGRTNLPLPRRRRYSALSPSQLSVTHCLQPPVSLLSPSFPLVCRRSWEEGLRRGFWKHHEPFPKNLLRSPYPL